MAPLLKKKNPEGDRGKERPERKFIDLADFKLPDVPDVERKHLKVAEIQRFEDLMRISDFVYNGDILILDCTPVAGDELQMRRIIQEVRTIGKDVDGDVAGITKNLIAITPRGMAIDRNRIRGSF
ncbi:hypothetical protein IX51_04895 [uncultured archaeon]|nr:hypothetical protein IX51_04895 [uncultured archaeon]